MGAQEGIKANHLFYTSLLTVMKQGCGAKINYSEVHNVTIGTCNVFRSMVKFGFT